VACVDREPLACVREWFGLHGWTPFAFQEEVWRAYLAGESGLVHAATGTGKTYAAWLGPVLEWLRDYPGRPAQAGACSAPGSVGDAAARPRRRYRIGTPGAGRGFRAALDGREPHRRHLRGVRARQRERLPTALVTTPESLTLLLTRDDAPELFEHLELVVVDEWHELLASKRGVQTELALARLRRLRPSLRTLGLSATLGNLDVARDALLGLDTDGRPRPGRLMQGHLPKALEVDALIPETMERFPWSGQMGLRMVPEVARAIEEGESALVFTNTRPPPRSGTRRCSRRGPTGPASWRSTTGRWTAAPASGWKTGSGRASSAASCAPPRSIWAWTSRPWTGSSRSAARRRSAAWSSGPGAADTSRAR
jgi:Lhr-like helicases